MGQFPGGLSKEGRSRKRRRMTAAAALVSQPLLVWFKLEPNHKQRLKILGVLPEKFREPPLPLRTCEHMTTDSKSFLQELDDAVLRGSAESREKALSYATDMLMIGRYSDEDIWMFGEVSGRLADAIEVAARAQLSRRLANASHAPINVVKKLAFDDAIEVAGPILQHCERLDSETLVANIRTKSQPHLLGVSRPGW